MGSQLLTILSINLYLMFVRDKIDCWVIFSYHVSWREISYLLSIHLSPEQGGHAATQDCGGGAGCALVRSCQRDEAHPRCSEARCYRRYSLTRRPGSHYSLATLQRDQHRQLLPDGTPCML